MCAELVVQGMGASSSATKEPTAKSMERLDLLDSLRIRDTDDKLAQHVLPFQKDKHSRFHIRAYERSGR